MVSVTLFHASSDTGNLGVTALGYSVIAGLSRRIKNLSLTVADFGTGIRSETLSVDGRPFQYQRCGVHFSRRLHRPETIWNIRLAARFGGAWNAIARHLMKQDFILDISGGDSFSDIYGPKQFQAGVQIKRLFLDRNIPVGLLPQTYGPFKNSAHRAMAVDLIRRAQFAWARDERSFSTLRELLRSDFDPERHRSGVDVAFLLDTVKPTEAEIEVEVAKWMSTASEPMIGLNVSGMIYNDPESATKHYGFVADYRRVHIEFVRRVLEQSDARILFVPHVAAAGHVQSDIAACRDVCGNFEREFPGRLFVLQDFQDPRHVKWVISQCDWFCGTRMHATIAGLSTGVPTAAVAYSLKTAGVFETCGQGAHVADPRELDTEAMIKRLWQSWILRQDARQSLAAVLPRVLKQANSQMDEIAEACQSYRVTSPAGAITR